MMNNIPKVKPYEVQNNKKNQAQKEQQNQKKAISTTLEGVLLNKSRESNYEPLSSLVILENQQPVKLKDKKQNDEFNLRKAAIPIMIGTLSIFGAAAGLSTILKASAKNILKTKPIEQLSDLALNMNIRQEPHFAAYMALRNPNIKTILGAGGVFLMSGLTLAAKNCVDGIKEIWIKKQESDIHRDLEEKLIETETQSFSGKLSVERNILSTTAKYFDSVLNKKTSDAQMTLNKTPNVFKSLVSFSGNNNAAENSKSNDKKKENIKLVIMGAATVIASTAFALVSFKNLKTATAIANDYTNKFTESIIDVINSTVENPNSQSKKGLDKVINSMKKVPGFLKKLVTKNTADAEGLSPKVAELSKLYETICATPQYVRESLTKMGAKESEIQKVIQNVADAKKSIFADAPVALGGITKKIQYYCYIDEERGHLYNWIMHPENKFLKYVFMAFSAISGTGYVGKQIADALKSVTVSKENSKTELNMQKKLVNVEINNFESKKNCAVKPLLDDFNKRLAEGKSDEELKTLADNILMEIKTGPPFVYS